MSATIHYLCAPTELPEPLLSPQDAIAVALGLSLPQHVADQAAIDAVEALEVCGWAVVKMGSRT